METPMKRPTSVTVIAWVWIIVGGLMVLSGCMVAMMSAVMSSTGMMDEAFKDVEQEGGQGLPPPLGMMDFVFRHFVWLALGQACIGAVGLWAGTSFLRRRAWARTVLEVLSWLFLIYVVGFTIFWMFGWTSMGAGHAPDAFVVVGLVAAVFGMAFYGVPLAIMIRFLRSRKVRDAVRVGGAYAPPIARPVEPPTQDR